MDVADNRVVNGLTPTDSDSSRQPGISKQAASHHALNRQHTEERNGRFRRIAWPYLADLLRTARFLTPREVDAEDLVQETMIKAMRAIHSFEDGTYAKAWLMTILRRTHIDRMRKEKASRETLVLVEDVHDAPVVESAPEELDKRRENPENVLEQFDDQTLIAALKRLPDEIHWTLLLVDVEQLKHH